jgi:hypothetical protein
MANLDKVSFRVRFILSTCPELWGLYLQCSFQLVPPAWASPYRTLLMKAGPLSELRVLGMPYLGMISSSKTLATTWAVSHFVGKASTQPEKVSIRTNKYLYPYLPGFTSVKSTSQLCPGTLPRTRVPVCRSPFLLGFIAWHPAHWSTIL